MKPRYALMYVMDVRLKDQIRFASSQGPGLVVEKIKQDEGVYKITIETGGGRISKTLNDTRKVWIEIP